MTEFIINTWPTDSNKDRQTDGQTDLAELGRVHVTQHDGVWGVGHQIAVVTQDLDFIDLVAVEWLEHHARPTRQVLHNHLVVDK